MSMNETQLREAATTTLERALRAFAKATFLEGNATDEKHHADLFAKVGLACAAIRHGSRDEARKMPKGKTPQAFGYDDTLGKVHPLLGWITPLAHVRDVAEGVSMDTHDASEAALWALCEAIGADACIALSFEAHDRSEAVTVDAVRGAA